MPNIWKRFPTRPEQFTTRREREAFITGFIDGITRYAWWKDGEQQVGTCGWRLKEEVEKVKAEYEGWVKQGTEP